MMRIWAIAVNTFREAIRNRILHSILFFAIGMILMSVALKDVTIGEQEKVVRSIAQTSIDFFASIIAMFLGISSIGKEIENKTIYTLLSKPIGKRHFILGKYMGLMLTIGLEIILLATFYTIFIGLQQSMPAPIFYMSLVVLFVEMMLLTACSVLCAAYSKPTEAAGFIMAIFVIGHLADDIWLFSTEAENPNFREIGQTLYYLLPNFEALSIRTEAIHQEAISLTQSALAIGYGLSYTAIVLTIAIVLFQRRDIN